MILKIIIAIIAIVVSVLTVVDKALAAPTNPLPAMSSYNCKMMGMYAQLWAITPRGQELAVVGDRYASLVGNQSPEHALLSLGVFLAAKAEFDRLPAHTKRDTTAVADAVETTCIKKFIKTM